jgi:hypothetical protein
MKSPHLGGEAVVLRRFARRFNHAQPQQSQETMAKLKQMHRKSFLQNSTAILKQTAQEWLEDKALQPGAALAYYTVFLSHRLSSCSWRSSVSYSAMTRPGHGAK